MAHGSRKIVTWLNLSMVSSCRWRYFNQKGSLVQKLLTEAAVSMICSMFNRARILENST